MTVRLADGCRVPSEQLTLQMQFWLSAVRPSSVGESSVIPLTHSLHPC